MFSSHSKLELLAHLLSLKSSASVQAFQFTKTMSCPKSATSMHGHQTETTLRVSMFNMWSSSKFMMSQVGKEASI